MVDQGRAQEFRMGHFALLCKLVKDRVPMSFSTLTPLYSYAGE